MLRVAAVFLAIAADRRPLRIRIRSSASHGKGARILFFIFAVLAVLSSWGRVPEAGCSELRVELNPLLTCRRLFP